MRYHQTVGVALISASALLFPSVKEFLQVMVKERKVIAEESQARAEIVQLELAKKRS
jgi:hypothetical protein